MLSAASVATTAIVVLSGLSSVCRSANAAIWSAGGGDQAELLDLIRQPRQPGRRVDDVARGVDDDQRADGDTRFERHRRGPDAALEHADARAGARADGADARRRFPPLSAAA